MSEFTLNPTSIKEKQDLFESELFTKLDEIKTRNCYSIYI